MTTLTRRDIFLDTSAFYALTDSQDINRNASLAIRQRLINEHWRLFTTNFVLAETHALFLARLGRFVALQVVQDTSRSVVRIIRVQQGDEVRGLGIVERYDDKNFSLTDATSFAVMDRLGIDVAFAFDRNFAQYGLELMAP